MIDPRLLSVEIEVNRQVRAYKDLAITVSGQKFASSSQAEATITIANLARDVVDQILTDTSPFNADPNPKIIRVFAGRVSYGTDLLYEGNIFRTEISAPPDQVLTIKALANNISKSKIAALSMPTESTVSEIAQKVAGLIGCGLQFEATDKTVLNYQFTGAVLKHVDKIETLGDYSAFIDGGILVVKDMRAALKGVQAQITGENIIGMPTLTDQGLKITVLYDPRFKVGGVAKIVGSRYKRANGLWTIFKLNFNLTNRAIPFYLTIEALPHGK